MKDEREAKGEFFVQREAYRSIPSLASPAESMTEGRGAAYRKGWEGRRTEEGGEGRRREQEAKKGWDRQGESLRVKGSWR
ncbi:hypothetical protein E2C01_075098 [Portunus trituberculatus]|uniref:Uncharacterized protein n=1 Tax=Portunus trituberculatus TaxID=210409 RepID=A0A5B7II83_PORTR|nr:hypothetical protein [Portunus trituberculatus]